MTTPADADADDVILSMDEVVALSRSILRAGGFSSAHAAAMTRVIAPAQRDGCDSHGLYRLIGCVRSVQHGKADGHAIPAVDESAPAIVRVDAGRGFSPLAFEAGLPALVRKARELGMAAMVIDRCYHFSALWPEVEALAAEGLVSLAMTPSYSAVAPAGGTRPLFGTNPIAFGWPRPGGQHPYVFDFATSAVARGEIELHHRAGKATPPGWGLDRQGQPTTDAAAILSGAMTSFGGHKGSAIGLMVELLAGAMIGNLTSPEALAHDDGAGALPYHGELVVAFSPPAFASAEEQHRRAEALFGAVLDQGARLASQRRYARRQASLAEGVRVIRPLHEELLRMKRDS